jgi:hypothetical protein
MTEFEKELRRMREADRERRSAELAALLRDAAALQALRASPLPLTAEQRRMLNHARVEIGERLADMLMHWGALGGSIRLDLDYSRLEAGATLPEPSTAEASRDAEAHPARPTGRRRYQYRTQPGKAATKVDVTPSEVLELVPVIADAASVDDLVAVVRQLFDLLGPLAQRHDAKDFPPPLVSALQKFWSTLGDARLRITPPSDQRRVRFGYRRESGAAVPDRVEQAVLDFVRRREAEGGSIAHIALELSLLQVPARGDRWHRAQLDRLVHEDPEAPEGSAEARARKPAGVTWQVRGDWREVEADLKLLRTKGILRVGFVRNAELRSRDVNRALTAIFVLAGPTDARKAADTLMTSFPDAIIVEFPPEDNAPGTLVMYALA